MNYLTISASVLLTLTASSAAYCQTSDAARYINAQGVEIIQARPLPAQADGAVITPKTGMVSKVKAQPVSMPADSKMQVSVKEQRSRDQDRLTILTEELANEGKAFENKIKIMQSPAMKAKLSSEELTRLQETMVDHEKNMRTLRAEIGRVRNSH